MKRKFNWLKLRIMIGSFVLVGIFGIVYFEVSYKINGLIWFNIWATGMVCGLLGLFVEVLIGKKMLWFNLKNSKKSDGKLMETIEKFAMGYFKTSKKNGRSKNKN